MVPLYNVLKVAGDTARDAGRYIKDNLGKVKRIEFKGERNIVTDVDKKSEEIIKTRLSKYFPTFNILGEEFGGNVSSEYYWLIDPLDGSNNFSHSFPVFCISIALMRKKESLAGVIYDPVRDELFYASKGKGAYLNRKRIRVSSINKLKHSLLATGFYYEFKNQSDTNIEHFINFLYRCQGIRRTGAAAIDLAYVAAGRLDGFWELGLKPWDTAAGYLLVKEAGGEVTMLKGGKYNPFFPEIVSSNGLIHKEMLRVFSLNKK